MRAHNAKQAQDRLLAGELWKDHGLVFASAVGTPFDPSHVRRGFRRACENAGIGTNWSPRELRHTFVSIMSEQGVPVEEIARLVGHSTTATTETVYRRELRPVISTGGRSDPTLWCRLVPGQALAFLTPCNPSVHPPGHARERAFRKDDDRSQPVTKRWNFNPIPNRRHVADQGTHAQRPIVDGVRQRLETTPATALSPLAGQVRGVAQMGQRRAAAVAMAMSTASWCSRLEAPSPDRQVAHTQSRNCLGTRYQ